MDPLLTELRQRLDRLGYVVVPHGDYLCVRLPLVCSVRIYSSDAGVRFAPQFGPFSRTRGLPLTSAAASTIVGALLFTVGVSPVALFAAFLGITALAQDACRFVLTEACITRLQQVILELGRDALSPGVRGRELRGPPIDSLLPPVRTAAGEKLPLSGR